VKDLDREPFIAVMSVVYEKARRDPATANLIDRIRNVE